MTEIKEIALALSKLQGEIINATKDKKGYNYTYADLAQVLEISRPLMAKYEMSITQLPTTKSEGKIGLTTILMHSSGQFIESFYELPIEAAAKMSTAQACGSVITYMRRYALAAVLGITQTDDDAQMQVVKKAQASIDEETLKDTIKNLKSAQTFDELMDMHRNLDVALRAPCQTAFSKRRKELENESQ